MIGRCAEGRSPRARGKRHPSPRTRRRWRSIPASAGEAWPPGAAARAVWVDPRERGGSRIGAGHRAVAPGRSPRARGKRRSANPLGTLARSIPASAGEAQRGAHADAGDRVDPRERGGSTARAAPPFQPAGRSPRARGKLAGAPLVAPRWRSIPASAGEANRRPLLKNASQVDPRERGGSALLTFAAIGVEGRSPRARGKQDQSRNGRSLTRSIPASAGEACLRRLRTRRRKVDPRERGGSSSGCYGRRCEPGRSPRARGKRGHPHAGCVPDRSIPASAGEAVVGAAQRDRSRVDPRERGGS